MFLFSNAAIAGLCNAIRSESPCAHGQGKGEIARSTLQTASAGQAYLGFHGYHSVIPANLRQAFVAVDPRVGEAGVLVSTEGEHSGVHSLCVEHLQPPRPASIR